MYILLIILVKVLGTKRIFFPLLSLLFVKRYVLDVDYYLIYFLLLIISLASVTGISTNRLWIGLIKGRRSILNKALLFEYWRDFD